MINANAKGKNMRHLKLNDLLTIEVTNPSFEVSEKDINKYYEMFDAEYRQYPESASIKTKNVFYHALAAQKAANKKVFDTFDFDA